MRSIRLSRLDERGVALPVALFGLVAVSLLVTSALLTSSTELALSRAHQDGTRGLYAADAALEHFVADRMATADPASRFEDGVFDVSTNADDPYRVTVTTLRYSLETGADGSSQRRETYSLLSARTDERGRGVGALIDVVRSGNSPFVIDAGLTLGTHGTISGNATVSDGSHGSSCELDSDRYAVRYSSDVDLDWGGNGKAQGAVVQDERTASVLAAAVMGRTTAENLTALAQIRFGPMFDRPRFNGSPAANHSNEAYRWGCPAGLRNGCSSAAAQYFPTIAIDAGGGNVDISGGYGQGVLVIRNGSISVSGNFDFQGIVLVEGSADIRGNLDFKGVFLIEGALEIRGNTMLEGAVVVLGDQAVIDPGESSDARGNTTIRYDPCQVEAAHNLITHSFDDAPQMIEGPTYAWFEVTR